MNTLFFHPVGLRKEAPSRGQHGPLKLTPSKIGRVPGKERVEGAGSHLNVNSIAWASADGAETLTHSHRASWRLTEAHAAYPGSLGQLRCISLATGV